jgi:hypothetical protein
MSCVGKLDPHLFCYGDVFDNLLISLAALVVFRNFIAMAGDKDNDGQTGQNNGQNQAK